MSWGLGWKRLSESFHLTLSYGSDADTLDEIIRKTSSSFPSSSQDAVTTNNNQELLGFRIDLDWNAGDDEDQVALRLQSQVMIALPSPNDSVEVELRERAENWEENLASSTDGEGNLENPAGQVKRLEVLMSIVTKREPLKGIIMSRAGGSGQQADGGMGVLIKLMKLNMGSGDANGMARGLAWRSIGKIFLLSSSVALSAEITRLPLLEKLYLDNNKLLVLPPELGALKSLKVLAADYNMLVSVPAELRQCTGLVELSLEHNKLVRPLLDFRDMAKLCVLRLFGNPLEFLPDILPLHELRHLSLANIRIVADENLGAVNVRIEVRNDKGSKGYYEKQVYDIKLHYALLWLLMQMENSSYFVASKHKLSEFFSLIFRFSSCHHPLLASALAKIMQDEENRVVVGKDETALRQLISMISSENQHVVEQACSALSSLASDVPVAILLIKLDIMQPISRALRSAGPEKVKRLALFAVGNLAFCTENRRVLVTSESLRDLLLRLTVVSESRVCKAAARALAILGENEVLRRAIRGRKVPKRGLRILAMDGGGMKGMATVKILKEIERNTGKQMHELFDLICGTSTGGMLAVALGIKAMSLERCEGIYKELGKVVFAAAPSPKDNEAATWREKLDQLYKSSSQSFRVVHGSKHSADEFERLLKEMCGDDDGDLLIESAVKRIPKVFVVSTLYPAGTPEISFAASENMTTSGQGAATSGAEVGYKRIASIGSCKHHIWQAIRASSAAPYYLDDFSDGVYRWQDGAIVANNPTIFAVREAQLLWPDAKIDCLVSIGCGSVPTKVSTDVFMFFCCFPTEDLPLGFLYDLGSFQDLKNQRVRKGGWRYLDTGQVLIESACSVDRVEEALSTLLPLLPDVRYFRFNPVDERCEIELDETDPAVWIQLEDATDDYIRNNSIAFKNLAERLLESQHDEKLSDGLQSQQLPRAKGITMSTTLNPSLVAPASHSPETGRGFNHIRVLKTFCASNGIRLSLVNGASGTTKTAQGSVFPTPFASPLFTGSISSSPLLYSPDRVVSLHEKIQNSPHVGVIHLALQNDARGSILSWQNDVFVVAEPGELAEKFLQNVKYSLLSMMKGRRKYASIITNISTVADLVSCRPSFQIGGVVHRYIGRQTQVMEDDQEIAAYMFRRTVPSAHLTPEDVRCMVGDWRDRIIIFTGIFGPTQALIKALLDSGAKAVVSPSSEPEEMQLMSFYRPGDFGCFKDGGWWKSGYCFKKFSCITSGPEIFMSPPKHTVAFQLESDFSGEGHEWMLLHAILRLPILVKSAENIMTNSTEKQRMKGIKKMERTEGASLLQVKEILPRRILFTDILWNCCLA
ncbi:UNVERIFIED_CONTAM: Phospholipase A I [Sesamum radiatum]|uniref:Phospholipase A I n=1 Tax=Sesamum radiatum TaxID=300843 RepID=A0AAW2ITU2_SESRA